MSTLMDEEIKRWTAKRKTALVLEIIQGKTNVSETSRPTTCRRRRSRAGWKTAARAWRTP